MQRTVQGRADRPEQALNTAGVYAAMNERLARIGAENSARLLEMQRKLGIASASGSACAAEAPNSALAEGQRETDVLEKGTAVLYRDKQSGEVLEVTVVKVHYDDVPPYYCIRLASGQERETVHERLWHTVRSDPSGTRPGNDLACTLGPPSPGVPLGRGSHAEDEQLVLGPLSPGCQLGWAPRRAANASACIQSASAEISEPEIYLPSSRGRPRTALLTAFRQDHSPAGPAGCSWSPTRQGRR